MQKTTLLSISISCLFIFLLSCSETTEPQITTGTTRLNITLNNVGELSKPSEIQLAHLYIHMNKGILDVYDTIPLNGNSEVLVSQSYVDMSEGLWSASVYSEDANSEVIHADTTEFTVVADFTVDVDLTLISKYSMLIANFNGITDGVYRCELLVDEAVVADSSFTPQDILDFNLSLEYDYLTSGETHDISLDAYGEYESIEYLFYTCDTTINVLPGIDQSYELEMLWVGPYGALKGTAILEVVIGASGTISMDAEFPLPADVLEDIDGNLYNSVLVGTQIWMAENLKVTRYRNGDPIDNLDNIDWANTIEGAYYDGYAELLGNHYNWYSVADSRNIAPAGWHVPTNAEWQILVNYLGGSDVAGGKLKSEGTEQWESPNQGATNESGFSAIPAGYLNSSTTYYGANSVARFWTSTLYFETSAYRYSLTSLQSSVVASYNSISDGLGYSIRCVKDSD